MTTRYAHKDAYTYENSAVLKNKAGHRDQEALDQFERLSVANRMVEDPPAGNFDYQHIKAIQPPPVPGRLRLGRRGKDRLHQQGRDSLSAIPVSSPIRSLPSLENWPKITSSRDLPRTLSLSEPPTTCWSSTWPTLSGRKWPHGSLLSFAAGAKCRVRGGDGEAQRRLVECMRRRSGWKRTAHV